MNTETRRATVAGASVAKTGSLSRRLTLHTFRAMPIGHLLLELPEGETMHLGAADPATAHWHAAANAPAARAISETAIIRVRREVFFRKCALQGDIGFAEAYIDGDWETPDLAAVVAWFVLNHAHAPTLSGSRQARTLFVNFFRAANRLRHLLRPNTTTLATRNIRAHYDLSNDFFALWLDPSLMYSAGRYTRADFSPVEAQHEKNAALCRRLRLEPSDHLLEIGTGWGGFSIHAAKHHGCRVTTLTISAEQHALATKRVAEAGLADRIEVRLQDYRELAATDARFDKIVSIEMLEAVGHRYLDTWCEAVDRLLKPDGLLALQFITVPDHRYEALRSGVDFIQKHIFPGSLLISLNRLNERLSKHGHFILNELEDLGQDYARTLRDWHSAFEKNSAAVCALGFDERFMRKWAYYLRYCEAAFALRHISVVQTLHTRPNNLRLA